MTLLAAAAGAHWSQDPTVWVALALGVLLLAFWKMGVPGMLTKALDDRGAAIKNELDQARRLKDEAQKLLDEYKAKRNEADNEAKSILDNAKRDAEALAADTRRVLKESSRATDKDRGREDCACRSAGDQRSARDGSRCRHRGRGKDRRGQDVWCCRRRSDRSRHPRSQEASELKRPLACCCRQVGRRIVADVPFP